MQAATESKGRPKARDLGTAGEPELVSIEETVRIVGVCRSLVYEHLTGAREPRLPSVKVGKRRLVPRQAIPAWVAKLMTMQAA